MLVYPSNVCLESVLGFPAGLAFSLRGQCPLSFPSRGTRVARQWQSQCYRRRSAEEYHDLRRIQAGGSDHSVRLFRFLAVCRPRNGVCRMTGQGFIDVRYVSDFIHLVPCLSETFGISSRISPSSTNTSSLPLSSVLDLPTFTECHG